MDNVNEKIIEQLEEVIKTYGKLKFVTIDPTGSTKKDNPNPYITDSLNLKICPTLYPKYTIRDSAEYIYYWAVRNGCIRDHGEFYICEEGPFVTKWGDCDWFWKDKHYEEYHIGYMRPIKISW